MRINFKKQNINNIVILHIKKHKTLTSRIQGWKTQIQSTVKKRVTLSDPVDQTSLLYTIEASPTKSICQTLAQREGVGLQKALKTCKELGIPHHKTWNTMTIIQKEQVIKYLKKNQTRMIDTTFRQKRLQSIRRLIQAKHYRGLRYCYCLPTKGQNTQTNRYTARRMGLQIMLFFQRLREQVNKKKSKKEQNIKTKKSSKKNSSL